MDIALASCARLPEPDFDEAPLRAALADAGLSCAVLAWDEPSIDWATARLTLIRSTWNYAHHPGRFLDWAASVAACSDLWNPLEIVRWSTHKRYLLELADAGVAVTPTTLVARGSRESLARIVDASGWRSVVVKPAVSAASYRTIRIDSETLDDGERHLQRLLVDGDVLIQQYLPSVEEYGERALIWIEGELTHAVRKSPRFAGEHENVSTTPVDIAPPEAELAEAALAVLRGAVGMSPMYARIDVAPGLDGEPVIMELELVEPSLFFPQSPAALQRLVIAIERRLRR
jgi:glutathione synthase/RimK-type ligase-like ATP-grasp enzyme